ncbi:MAG: hypothetical protein NC416_02750 [Eubacterium sp.]|nr:hypothetical protein [Eubacterium sp.]
MRNFIKKSTCWIHSALIIAIIIPLIYALSTELPAAFAQSLFFKCLIILLPLVLSDLAVEKCKGLLLYLITGVLIFALTGIFAWCIAGSLRQDNQFFLWGYMTLSLCETAFVIFNRLAERLHKIKEAEAAQGEDPDWHPSRSFLREPSFMFLLYFLIVYVIAVNVNSPAVCNAALFSAIVYTVDTFLYQYVTETDNYLSLNKRTCNLPSKRIYGIGSGMLALFMLLLLVTVLPALFTISNRHYRDLRKMSFDVEIDYTEPIPENDTANTDEDFMAALMEEYGEVKPTPRWIILLSYAVEIAVFVVLALALLRKIFSTFQDFRKAVDDNGDVVENLKDADETIQPVKKPAPAIHHRLSERERIRKEYRKTIRRCRKDRPSPYETPLEIETNAGIADSEEGMELHRNYEWARYGEEVR